MCLEPFMERLGKIPGVASAEIIDDDVWHMICTEESTVKAAQGAIDMENIGLEDCGSRDIRICLFVGPEFEVRDDDVVRMVDDEGHIIGYNIDLARRDEFLAMDNVVFLCDDFILFTDVEIVGDQRFVMTSVPYRGDGDWIPEHMDSVLWFPCSTTSILLSEHYGKVQDDLAVCILALKM